LGRFHHTLNTPAPSGVERGCAASTGRLLGKPPNLTRGCIRPNPPPCPTWPSVDVSAALLYFPDQQAHANKANKQASQIKNKATQKGRGKGTRGKGKGESIAQTRARSCVWAPNARFWKSGATMAEVQRGRVRCGRDTKWGLLPEAVVGLPGRAYCFTRGRQKVGDDQLNTVSRGGGKPMLEPGKKKPSKHESISTAAKQNCPKSQIPKFRIWARKCFPPHPIPKQSFPNFGIWVCLS
jgi:hypothetical protein